MKFGGDACVVVFYAAAVSPVASESPLRARYHPRGYTNTLHLPHFFPTPLAMAVKRQEEKQH
jgi:hypothetical protein